MLQIETLPGYRLGAVLSQTPTAAVYEAVREHDRTPVLAKVIAAVAGETDEARFEHEYRLLSELDLAGVVRVLDLIRDGIRQVLVLERFPGLVHAPPVQR